MNNTIYCSVVNKALRKTTDYRTKFVPSKGDILPIHYMNEKVIDVIHVTPFLKEQNKDVNLEGCDLLVYTT